MQVVTAIRETQWEKARCPELVETCEHLHKHLLREVLLGHTARRMGTHDPDDERVKPSTSCRAGLVELPHAGQQASMSNVLCSDIEEWDVHHTRSSRHLGLAPVTCLVQRKMTITGRSCKNIVSTTSHCTWSQAGGEKNEVERALGPRRGERAVDLRVHDVVGEGLRACRRRSTAVASPAWLGVLKSPQTSGGMRQRTPCAGGAGAGHEPVELLEPQIPGPVVQVQVDQRSLVRRR